LSPVSIDLFTAPHGKPKVICISKIHAMLKKKLNFFWASCSIYDVKPGRTCHERAAVVKYDGMDNERNRRRRQGGR
jgi:hypothetical protein